MSFPKYTLIPKKYRFRTLTLLKSFANPFLSRKKSIPIFVFGAQRSGTTMLINAFNILNDFYVYRESDHRAFDDDYRIIDYKTVENLIDKSNFKFTVFKPISDSHLINEFLAKFPEAKAIWIYRNYKDVCNSSAKKWRSQDRNSINEIGTGNIRDDWFTEGLSDDDLATIKRSYTDKFSLHDCNSLWWWARNRIVTRSELCAKSNVLLVDYDRLATHPADEIRNISRFIESPEFVESSSYIHSKSVGKDPFPEIDGNVKALCDELSDQLENCYCHNREVIGLPPLLSANKG